MGRLACVLVVVLFLVCLGAVLSMPVTCDVEPDLWKRVAARFGTDHVGIPCWKDRSAISDEVKVSLNLPSGFVAWKCRPEVRVQGCWLCRADCFHQFFDRLSQRVRDPIAGVTVSLKNLMTYISRSNNKIHTFLVGGAVRDVMQGIDPQDLDVTFVPNFEFAKQKIFGSLQNRDKSLFHTFALGARLGTFGQHLDIVKPDVNVLTESTNRDYTMNAIYMDLTDMTIIDVTGHAVTDIITNNIRIAHDHDKDQWCAADASNCPGKIMRYFHMRMKGFDGHPATRDFVMAHIDRQLNGQAGDLARGLVFKKVLMPCHTSECEAMIADRVQEFLNVYVEDFVSWKLASDPSAYYEANALIRSGVESFRQVFKKCFHELRHGRDSHWVAIMRSVPADMEYRGDYLMSMIKRNEGPYNNPSQCLAKTYHSLGLVSLLESKTVRSLRSLGGPAQEFSSGLFRVAMKHFGYMEYYWSHVMTEWPGARWAAKELGLRLVMFLAQAKAFTKINLVETGLPIPGGISYGRDASALRKISSILNDESTSIREILAFVWLVINHTEIKIGSKWSNDLHSAMDNLRVSQTSEYTKILSALSKSLDVCIAPSTQYEPCKNKELHTTDEGWIDLNYNMKGRGLDIPTSREGRTGQDFSLNCFDNEDLNPPLSAAELQQCSNQAFHDRRTPASADCAHSQVYNLGRSHYKLLYSDLPSAFMPTLRQEGFVMQSRLNGFRTVAGPSGSVAWLIEFARNVLGFSTSELLLLRIAMAANMAQTDGHSLYESVIGAERTMGHNFKMMEPIEHVDLFAALLSSDVTVSTNDKDTLSAEGDIMRGESHLETFTKEEMRTYMDTRISELSRTPFSSFYILANVMMAPLLNWVALQERFPREALIRAVGPEGSLAKSVENLLASKKDRALMTKVVHKLRKTNSHQSETLKLQTLLQTLRNGFKMEDGINLALRLVSIMKMADQYGGISLDFSELEDLVLPVHDAILEIVDHHFFNQRDFEKFGRASGQNGVQIPFHCEFPFELPAAIKERSNYQNPYACWTNVNTRRAMVYDEVEKMFTGLVPETIRYGTPVYALDVPDVERGTKLIVVGYRSSARTLVVRLASGSSRDNLPELLTVNFRSVSAEQTSARVVSRARRTAESMLAAGGNLGGVQTVHPCGQQNGVPQILVNSPQGGVMTDYVRPVITPDSVGVVDPSARAVVSRFMSDYPFGQRSVCMYSGANNIWKVSNVVAIDARSHTPIVECKNAMSRNMLVPLPHYHIGVPDPSGLINDSTKLRLGTQAVIRPASDFVSMLGSNIESKYLGTYWRNTKVEEIVKFTGYSRLSETNVYATTLSVVRSGFGQQERSRSVGFPQNSIMDMNSRTHRRIMIGEDTYELVGCAEVANFIHTYLQGKNIGLDNQILAVTGVRVRTGGKTGCEPVIDTNRGARIWNDAAMKQYLEDSRIKNEVDLYRGMCSQIAKVMHDQWFMKLEGYHSDKPLYHTVMAKVDGMRGSECQMRVGLQSSAMIGAWTQTVIEVRFDVADPDIFSIVAPATTASYPAEEFDVEAHPDVKKLLDTVLSKAGTGFAVPANMPNYHSWKDFPRPNKWAFVDADKDSERRYAALQDIINTVVSLQYVSASKVVFSTEVDFPELSIGGIKTPLPKAGDPVEFDYQGLTYYQPRIIHKAGEQCSSDCLIDLDKYVSITNRQYLENILKQIRAGKDTYHVVTTLVDAPAKPERSPTDVTMEQYNILRLPSGKFIVRANVKEGWFVGIFRQPRVTLNAGYFPDLIDVAKERHLEVLEWTEAAGLAIMQDEMTREANVEGYD